MFLAVYSLIDWFVLIDSFINSYLFICLLFGYFYVYLSIYLFILFNLIYLFII